jgi:phospholipase/carboxylesterase
MNRLASSHAHQATHSFTSHSSADFTADFSTNSQSGSYAGASTRGRRQRPIRQAAPGVALFAPIHYERRYAYPLLVWLHGHGGSERELRQLMPNVSVRNYVGASTRGALLSKGLSRDAAGGATWEQTPEACEAAAESVAECIEHAQRRYHIHPRRIFLAGRGVGGTMALRLALQFSLPLAGVVSLGGALPRGGCPFARVNEARKLPLMLMCARESQQYPQQQVADDLRLLHAAGCQLSIREYLCGDELYTDMFTDMDQWLMEKVCGAAATATA